MRACFTVFGKEAFRIKRDRRGGGGFWAPRVNASVFQAVASSFARYSMPVIVANSDTIFEEYVDMMSDQRFIDCVTKATGDAGNIKYAFETWNTRLQAVVQTNGDTNRNPRSFSRSLKDELYEFNQDCALCGNRITSIHDAHVDHVEQYWRGGKTIPENARLAHRACNQSRPRA